MRSSCTKPTPPQSWYRRHRGERSPQDRGVGSSCSRQSRGGGSPQAFCVFFLFAAPVAGVLAEPKNRRSNLLARKDGRRRAATRDRGIAGAGEPTGGRIHEV